MNLIMDVGADPPFYSATNFTFIGIYFTEMLGSWKWRGRTHRAIIIDRYKIEIFDLKDILFTNKADSDVILAAGIRMFAISWKPQVVPQRAPPLIHNSLTYMTLSGLQKEVLSLYRQLIRVARTKDTQENLRIPELLRLPGSSTRFVAHEFRRQANSVKRSNFKTIEYMIRKGEKQLKLLKMPGVGDVHGASTTR